MKLKFKKVTMPTDEIKITSAFSWSMPRLGKLKTCMDFYRANGYFDRQIIIDESKYLHDGYCAYLTAKLLDVQTVRVLMVSGVEEQRNPALDSKPSTGKAMKIQKQFHPGMLVKITGNTNGHRFNIGETVRLVEKLGAGWKAEYLGNHYYWWWWYVMECDMEPIESAEDEPSDSHKFTYNVGDRVMCKGHTGQVIGINDGNAHIIYLVDFDEPGVGYHNGNLIGVTVGKCGTSNNCLWRGDNGLQPMEPIESVEDKSTDSHKFTYNVGDRVTSGGHTGRVIGINEGDAYSRYLVDFDEPGVGWHNGNSLDVTVGKCGTSNNCLWRRDNDLQPIESNPEPTKMYCIKGDAGWLTKGKTYDFAGGIVCYDNGQFRNRNDESFDEWKRRNPDLSECLVPLVKRTAKVGEWIYVIKDSGGQVKAGTIWKVTGVDSIGVDLMGNYVCRHGNYLVLDGYTDKKEKRSI